jgi:4'-phosphopantetheinyl transferase
VLLLDAGEVHVWSVALGSGGPPEWNVLSTDEQVRAERYAFADDRDRFVAARGALREILASYVGCTPEGIAFRYGARGKPALAGDVGRARGLRFNLTHSHALAMIAVTREGEVGIDVEHVRAVADAEAIVRREFSRAEQQEFSTVPPGDRARAFLNAWVRKEAVLKATGEGLARPLSDVEVTLSPVNAPRLLALAADPTASSRWSLVAASPASDYVAALAVEARGVRVWLRSWRGRRLGVT